MDAIGEEIVGEALRKIPQKDFVKANRRPHGIRFISLKIERFMLILRSIMEPYLMS